MRHTLQQKIAFAKNRLLVRNDCLRITTETKDFREAGSSAETVDDGGKTEIINSNVVIFVMHINFLMNSIDSSYCAIFGWSVRV
jgi:hypothetical protein